MRSARRVVFALVLLVLVAYAAGMVWLVSQETQLVFQAGPSLGRGRPEPPFSQIEIPRADGAQQFAWLLPPGGRADRLAASNGGGADPGSGQGLWMLYLHGNASTIAGPYNLARYGRLRELGVHLLAPEYRGYGGLAGVPSEEALAADARAAYDYVRAGLGIPPERLVIYGWSLGSAVAVTLASQVPSAGVILEGAPASLVSIGQERYPLFPIRLLMRNPFESVTRVGRIRAPLLFLHSPDDTIVPIAQGRTLFAAAPEPKRFVEVRGGHLACSEVDAGVFYAAVAEFLDARQGR